MQTFTCPKGHSISEDQLKCYVSKNETDIDKSIQFTCECGKIHSFSLKTAMRAKMFTKEHAERIRKQADLLLFLVALTPLDDSYKDLTLPAQNSEGRV